MDMAETEQGDPLTENGESSGEGADSEQEKSVSLKNLQVFVTDISLEQPDITNGIKKRGRPKGSTKAAGDMNGEGEDLESPPRKRGRPKGTPKKFIQGEVQDTPQRGRPKKGQGKVKRGRPKKVIQARERQQESAEDGTGLPRKSPGRPKGSRNKVFIVSLENTSGRPVRVRVAPEKFTIALPEKNPGKRGRPKKGRRGRPRKEEYDDDDDDEEYKPSGWKTLGRPRKYPKEDLSEDASSDTPRRGRGRPRKSESKAAHLKKLNNNGSPESDKAPKDEKEQGPPKKRGRPKGSVKSKAIADNSSEKDSQNSDQNMEDVHEDGNVSDSPPPEDNSLNSEDNVSNDQQNKVEENE